MKHFSNLLKFFAVVLSVSLPVCIFVVTTASRSEQVFAQISLDSALASNTSSKIDFTVTVLCTADVQCDRGIKALKEAEKYIESRVAVKFQPLDILRSNEKVEGTLFERWMKWGQIAIKMGAAKSDLTVILVEDYPSSINDFDFEEEGVIGMASGIGVLGLQPSAIFVKIMGGERFLTRILIHELGHTLGAEHTEAGIMHPSASVNQYSDEYSIFSLNQIKDHLARVKLIRALRSIPTSKKRKEGEKANADIDKPKTLVPVVV